MKTALKQILTGWDVWVALVVTMVITKLSPEYFKVDFLKEVYNMGLTILAITFSVFFAGVALIMSSSHDDFVKFLEEQKEYSKIILCFIITLSILFISLCYSAIAFGIVSFASSVGKLETSKWPFCIFIFFFLYSLFAVVMATKETFTYSNYRAKFIKAIKP